jgi:hypothetical protein
MLHLCRVDEEELDIKLRHTLSSTNKIDLPGLKDWRSRAIHSQRELPV